MLMDCASALRFTCKDSTTCLHLLFKMTITAKKQAFVTHALSLQDIRNPEKYKDKTACYAHLKNWIAYVLIVTAGKELHLFI